MFRRNTAQTVYAVVVNATTGAAETSGVAVTVSKDGGAGASGTGTLAHISGGLWAYTFAAGELDATSTGFVFTKTGAVPVGGTIRTVQVDPDDATDFGLANLAVAVAAPPTPEAFAAAVLSLSAAAVEDDAPEHSLCYVILAATEASRSGATLTVRKTDGSSTFATKTLTSSASAEPVTGIS